MAWTTKSSVAPGLSDLRENRVDAGDILDVAGQSQRRAEAFGQRLDALAERLALIGEGEFRAFGGEGLGDAPGDGMIVGDAHDQAAFARHQALGGNIHA